MLSDLRLYFVSVLQNISVSVSVSLNEIIYIFPFQFQFPLTNITLLTTGLWGDGHELTTLCGEEAGSFFPVPGNSSGRRRRIYTRHFFDVVRLEIYAICPQLCPSLGRGPGSCLGPA